MEKKKQKWVIKKWLGGMPPRIIAAHLQISSQTAYRAIWKYKISGAIMAGKPRGRPKLELNPMCKKRIVEEWQTFQCGSVKLHKILCKQGFGVSQRKIQQVLDEYKLSAPCPKRRGQRKYCSYRWPACLAGWHTDWTHCPVTGKDLIAFIDDHSRFIVGYGLYDGATTKNTLACLYRCIFSYGVPHAIITDRGSHFYANKQTGKKQGKSGFQKALEYLGIKHIMARAHHPQTNGKIERWFGTYKREFNERFKDIDDYILFYNYVRPHQRLEYKTPAEVFFKARGVTNFDIPHRSDAKKKK